MKGHVNLSDPNRAVSRLHWYGILIVMGAILAAWLATIEARRGVVNPEHVWGLLTWVLILGIIGARLYHVFSTPTGEIRQLGILPAAPAGDHRRSGMAGSEAWASMAQ